jgi:methylglutaconyl-CoA hydratase
MRKFETIEFEIKNRVGNLWLNRPDVHNAFNNVMLDEIVECIGSINDSKDVVCLVIRGKGKSFCAGVDLNWMRDVTKNTYEENYNESLRLSKCFSTIYHCRKPTIAIIHGVSLGGANGILSACDFAYCYDDATFSLSEVKIGIIPACISPYVIKRVGEYGAKDLMISGKRIKGKEAEYYKLVNKSLPANEIDEYINSVIALLKTSGPAAMTQCKDLIFEVSNNLTLEEAYDYTAKMIADIRSSEEGQEGMAAFLEKRKPNWVKE